MTITTAPIFYFIDQVNSENNLMNFNEGSGEITSTNNIGSYAMSGLIIEVARSMNEVGTQEYTVALNRDTRLITISAASSFDLLITSGSNTGLSIYSLLGFTGADLVGGTSYEGNVAIGDSYSPQFPLQKFKGVDDNEEGIRASVNESASGVVEIVTFGFRRFMSFEITYINNYSHVKDSYLAGNANNIQEARDFLSFCIRKNFLEVMLDKTDTSTFEKILLEKTKKSSKGTSYELSEMISQNLIGFFKTGILTFRQIT